MQYHKDHYNLQQSEEPFMHTITTHADFMEDSSKSVKKGKGKKNKKDSDAMFQDFYGQKLTFEKADEVEIAKAQLSRMGRGDDPIEKKRNCCHLLTCKPYVWREYMQQHRHGVKWLWSLLIFQILYILSYLGVNFANNREDIIQYQYFNLVIMVWFMLFNVFFLRNATSRFLIEELKISIVVLMIMTFNSMVFYVISIIRLFNDQHLWIDGDHLKRLIFFMDFIGIGIGFLVLPLYAAVTYFVYQDMREFIVFHLDGNRIMWQNFIEVTMTRGILKLDVLANLEYFSCFVMLFTFNDESFKEEWPVWATIGGLFLVSLSIQAFGGYGTIVTAKNWRYRCYFTMRIILELIKLAIVVCIPILNRVLWLKFEFDGDFTQNQYMSFIILASMSVTFTLFTAIWSSLKIRKAQQLRKSNQSEQLKAMWRVEETHFNSKINQGSVLGSKYDNNNALILKRIIKSME